MPRGEAIRGRRPPGWPRQPALPVRIGVRHRDTGRRRAVLRRREAARRGALAPRAARTALPQRVSRAAPAARRLPRLRSLARQHREERAASRGRRRSPDAPHDRPHDAARRGRNTARYDEEILSMDLPTQLLGWFQTDRYFSHVADEVVQRLRLPPVTLPRPAKSPPIVALSFRRGDYVRLGWQLPFSYYEKALALMTSEVPDATFLVFGDDPEFVRLATDWVSRFGPATNAYDFSDGALEQLALASECDHAVIANSSFAWWGAWLGDRRAGGGPRLVIAPEDYRRPGGFDPTSCRATGSRSRASSPYDRARTLRRRSSPRSSARDRRGTAPSPRIRTPRERASCRAADAAAHSDARAPTGSRPRSR